MKKARVAVLVISIGERPFSALTLSNIKAYADRIGAEFIVEREIAIPFWLAFKCKLMKFKRKNIECYLQKMLGINKALENFDRVLLLDDSCLVSDGAPDIFDMVPEEEIGAFPESDCVDFKAPSYDKNFILKKKGVSISGYYNTGVLIVSKGHKDMFSPESLSSNLPLFKSMYPDQAYFAYMVEVNGIKVHKISSDWNFMPVFDYSDNSNRELLNLPEEHLDIVKQKNIVHVTGYYKNREKIIEQIYFALEEKLVRAKGSHG